MTEKQQYEVTVTKIRSTEYSDEVVWSHTFYTFATSESKAKQNIIYREHLNQKLECDDYCEEFYQFNINLVNDETQFDEYEEAEEEDISQAADNIQYISIFDDLDDIEDDYYAKPCK